MSNAEMGCRRGWGLAALVVLALAPSAWAQTPNACDPGEAPDVIVGSLHQVQRYGTLGGLTSYSVGTTSCNIGTCWLNWFQNSPDHPVIGQSVYRLKGGRMQQIGQGWLKHGFFALSGALCFSDCQSTDGAHLGVHCSDPYDSGLNGQQSNLGPKYDVHPSNGRFSYPYPTQGQTGNVIYKRIQVLNTDLDPAQNAGALYFVEGVYVAKDDAQSQKNLNNYSYRGISVGATPYDFTLLGATVQQEPTLNAWRANDPTVYIRTVKFNDYKDPSTMQIFQGQFVLGAKVTALGGNQWHYEYALQNTISDRGARAFRLALPVGVNVSNIGFSDVPYHSGEPWQGTDWTVTGGNPTDGFIEWATEPFALNANANALRWGTLYNFWFDADVAPTANTTGTIRIDLFKPGNDAALPDTLNVAGPAPATCDNDGVCESGESCTTCASDCSNQGGGGGCCGDGTCNAGESSCSCVADCGFPQDFEFVCNDGDDTDCDGLTDCQDPDCCPVAACAGPDADMDGFQACDCNDANAAVWFRPGEVEDVRMTHSATLGTTLSWLSPIQPGGTSLTYEVLRAMNPVSFLGSTACVPDPVPGDLSVVDTTAPTTEDTYYYLVRGSNACPQGDGLLGRRSNNIPIQGQNCP